MPREVADLVAQLAAATATGFRRRLLARGQAQSMIRRDGELPDESQTFGTYLDRDLLDYGYSLMSTAVRILDADRTETSFTEEEMAEQEEASRNGFLQASYALEAATRNADPNTPELAFHRLIAGAASHLAGYAARAFSLVEASRTSGRLAPMELTFTDLIMRDLGSIEARTIRLRTSAAVTDGALTAALSRDSYPGDTEGSEDPGSASAGEHPAQNPSVPGNTADGAAAGSEELSDLGPLTLLLSEHYLSTVSAALFAIAFGRDDILQQSITDLELGEDASNDISAPGPWWVFRLTRHIILDLNETSIRHNLPIRPPGDDGAADANADAGLVSDSVSPDAQHAVHQLATVEVAPAEEDFWQRLRRTYVATLMARDRAEIDLWPSQLHVVTRIFAGSEDLVVALPTSAGKTRIAELCMLRCLAQHRRVIYVTPLRALSAQTERIMERTFAPLGFRVSSLYGSMGVSDLDGDALKSSDIVIATPEKLDFALRSAPHVLDDVGVIILDEGHMIGPEEREVRYEAQIQRLLRRSDADARRIICLSAVFPDNEELDDFVNWITDDAEGGLHKENWRPTRQQFGLVQWRPAGHARLSITMGDDRPFIPRYLEARQPSRGRRKNNFPQNQNEMTLATAWRLVQEGETVLIFCPLRTSVATLATLIVKLHEQQLLESVMPTGVEVADALAIGTEWFGADHDVLKCLKLGVAVHHGALPGPFRREVEKLLHERVLTVTVASPTLAQGLNLSASVVLFSSLYRNGTLLGGSEFANVIGRAGRAFVDTEGLVLYPMYEFEPKRRSDWRRLTEGSRTRALQSGLITLGRQLLLRVSQIIDESSASAFVDYLTGGIDWTLPVVRGEDALEQATAQRGWKTNLARLDTAILSVVGDEAHNPADIIQVLADAMRDSLWERQLRRLDEREARSIRSVVEQRASFLWANSTPQQRRGWYLAGLGADAGTELALVAPRIVQLTDEAEVLIATGDALAADRIVDLAEHVFAVSTFAPIFAVNDRREVLRQWLAGQPLSSMREDPVDVSQFIEGDVIYRLVWGLEAARVYEMAQGNVSAELINGSATAALEAGTLSQAAAVLLRSGFDHRAAAIKAVTDTSADFTGVMGMRAWVNALDPALGGDPTWPTIASRNAWVAFTGRLGTHRSRRWGRQQLTLKAVRWDGHVPSAGEWLRVNQTGPGIVTLWSPGFDRLGTADIGLNQDREGTLYGVCGANGSVRLHYRGPSDLLPAGVEPA